MLALPFLFGLLSCGDDGAIDDGTEAEREFVAGLRQSPIFWSDGTGSVSMGVASALIVLQESQEQGIDLLSLYEDSRYADIRLSVAYLLLLGNSEGYLKIAASWAHGPWREERVLWRYVLRNDEEAHFLSEHYREALERVFARGRPDAADRIIEELRKELAKAND
jgi:hypothetical protein